MCKYMGNSKQFKLNQYIENMKKFNLMALEV